jgi:type IV conjugative transfer system protein TraE
MTAFFAQLRLTVTPSNAAFQRNTLLRYTDPSAYGELNNELVAEADHLTQGHISLAFYPTRIEVDVKQLSARIEGDLYSTVGNVPAHTSRITYLVHYAYNQGRLWLQSFEEASHGAKK